MEARKYTAGYENGSAARKLNQYPERIRQPHVVEQPAVQAEPKFCFGADIFSMLLLIATISATVFMCISYLKIQSDIVQLDKAITAKEKQITAIAKENDAVEAVLENEITDLEYIYQIAVGVLGMVYPNDNEVIYYQHEDTGYFRQYQDIPK